MLWLMCVASQSCTWQTCTKTLCMCHFHFHLMGVWLYLADLCAHASFVFPHDRCLTLWVVRQRWGTWQTCPLVCHFRFHLTTLNGQTVVDSNIKGTWQTCMHVSFSFLPDRCPTLWAARQWQTPRGTWQTCRPPDRCLTLAGRSLCTCIICISTWQLSNSVSCQTVADPKGYLTHLQSTWRVSDSTWQTSVHRHHLYFHLTAECEWPDSGHKGVPDRPAVHLTGVWLAGRPQCTYIICISTWQLSDSVSGQTVDPKCPPDKCEWSDCSGL